MYDDLKRELYYLAIDIIAFFKKLGIFLSLPFMFVYFLFHPEKRRR